MLLFACFVLPFGGFLFAMQLNQQQKYEKFLLSE
jgi:hypothetical protein